MLVIGPPGQALILGAMQASPPYVQTQWLPLRGDSPQCGEMSRSDRGPGRVSGVTEGD